MTISGVARAVSSSSCCSSALTREQIKPASVYANETWHSDRVLKPHVQRHNNITPVSFAAPSGALNPTNSVIIIQHYASLSLWNGARHGHS